VRSLEPYQVKPHIFVSGWKTFLPSHLLWFGIRSLQHQRSQAKYQVSPMSRLLIGKIRFLFEVTSLGKGFDTIEAGEIQLPTFDNTRANIGRFIDITNSLIALLLITTGKYQFLGVVCRQMLRRLKAKSDVRASRISYLLRMEASRNQ